MDLTWKCYLNLSEKFEKVVIKFDMNKLNYIKDIKVAKIVRRSKFEVALGGALSAKNFSKRIMNKILGKNMKFHEK